MSIRDIADPDTGADAAHAGFYADTDTDSAICSVAANQPDSADDYARACAVLYLSF